MAEGYLHEHARMSYMRGGEFWLLFFFFFEGSKEKGRGPAEVQRLKRNIAVLFRELFRIYKKERRDKYDMKSKKLAETSIKHKTINLFLYNPKHDFLKT